MLITEIAKNLFLEAKKFSLLMIEGRFSRTFFRSIFGREANSEVIEIFELGTGVEHNKSEIPKKWLRGTEELFNSLYFMQSKNV